jgi:hypothetical protein
MDTQATTAPHGYIHRKDDYLKRSRSSCSVLDALGIPWKVGHCACRVETIRGGARAHGPSRG